MIFMYLTGFQSGGKDKIILEMDYMITVFISPLKKHTRWAKVHFQRVLRQTLGSN